LDADKVEVRPAALVARWLRPQGAGYQEERTAAFQHEILSSKLLND
jgi:hypothetical protein